MSPLKLDKTGPFFCITRKEEKRSLTN